MPTLEDIKAMALQSGLKMFTPSPPAPDMGTMATALGPQAAAGTGAFGGVNMFGAMPEEIVDVAKARSAANYQKMLTDLGALEFIQKATNLEGKNRLATEVTGHLIQGENAKEVARIHGQYELAATKASPEKALQNLKADAVRKMLLYMAHPDKVARPNEYEMQLAGFDDPLNLSNALKIKDKSAQYRSLKELVGNDPSKAALLEPLAPYADMESLADAAMKKAGVRYGTAESSTDNAMEDWVTRAGAVNPGASRQELINYYKTHKTGASK